MKELDKYDLTFSIRRLPVFLREKMKEERWKGKIFVGGGFIRAVTSGEKVNDIDLFVSSKEDALELFDYLKEDRRTIETDNALTIIGKPPIQIITRWLFQNAEDVQRSFDFTVCCAAIFYDGIWKSVTDERYYVDLAAKRLVYRSPDRNEDSGGSMLRVLKYYQRGYRIPLESLGAVLGRLFTGVRQRDVNITDEVEVSRVIAGLLREVDPLIDPTHEAHEPSVVDPEAF